MEQGKRIMGKKYQIIVHTPYVSEIDFETNSLLVAGAYARLMSWIKGPSHIYQLEQQRIL